MARPGLYQRRPTWGSGQDFHLRIDLKPLDKRDGRDLAAEILQKVQDLPRELRDLIVERAEGNPYYMEELVKMLIEDRVIQKLDEERWTVEVSRLKQLRVPPTLVGLLQARFDSLLYPATCGRGRSCVLRQRPDLHGCGR
jgi:predicted ATPase